MIFHEQSAAGKWKEMTRAQQMANIGSEVMRAINWQSRKGEEKHFQNATGRALELFDLTLSDPRWPKKEIARAREVFCEYLFGDNQFGVNIKDLDKYFTQFTLAARAHT